MAVLDYDYQYASRTPMQLEVLESPATAEAMAYDGVLPESAAEMQRNRTLEQDTRPAEVIGTRALLQGQPQAGRGLLDRNPSGRSVILWRMMRSEQPI